MQALSSMIVSPDEFGAEFYDLLDFPRKSLVRISGDPPKFPQSLFENPPDLVVFAAMISDVHLCSAIESVAQLLRAVFIPVLISNCEAIVGPVWTPFGGACWSCFEKRRKQAGRMVPNLTVMGSISRIDAKVFALLTAERVSALFSETKRDAPVAGTIWEFDGLSTSVEEQRIVGVHNCVRCGIKRDPKSLSTTMILSECAFLWDNNNASSLQA